MGRFNITLKSGNFVNRVKNCRPLRRLGKVKKENRRSEARSPDGTWRSGGGDKPERIPTQSGGSEG